ncbi:MAG: hypothetical protein ABSD10_01320 [Candidatus Saccharimonadales bacterium]
MDNNDIKRSAYMRPESLKLKVQELSTADLKQEHDEARRIVLTERIEAVQGDLADFFKKIIPPGERYLTSLNIVCDNVDDNQLGKGRVVAQVINLTKDHLGRATDELRGVHSIITPDFGYLIRYRLETENGQASWNWGELAREFFGKAKDAARAEGEPHKYDVVNFESVEDMEHSVTTMEATAPETIQMLLCAASNLSLNPEYAALLSSAVQVA